ncbi:MAG: S9 family peptidase [Pseudomonadota bacterium]
MKFLRPFLLTVATASLCSTATSAPPVSAFTAYPQIQDVKISPGGKFLAVTKRSEEFELLSVLRYPDLAVQTSSHFGDQIDIDTFDWTSDSRLLIQPARRFIGYRAYKVRTGEIIGVDVIGKRSDMLFGYRAGSAATGTIIQARRATDAWAEIVKILPPETDAVLIRTGSYDRKTNSSSLMRMNVRNGSLARIAGSPIRNPYYLIDANNQPVFLTGDDERGDYSIYRFRPEDKGWEFVEKSIDGKGQIEPFAVTTNPEEFLAFDNQTTLTKSIIVWNPTTRNRQPLFHKDISDISVEGVDPDDKVYLYGYEDNYREYLYPDPEHPLAKVHRSLRAGFKDANISITSTTRDMALAVALISAPRIPPTFYLVDVKNLKLLQKLPAYPGLKKEDLSPTDPFEVTVRDGMKIRGYLTTPNGVAQKNLPMIVFLHGGPQSHDSYGFDSEVQLLASRGYAVMQLNFRGSDGRGRDFIFAGYGKWGREMQDDVTDAVKWAIASGIADRGRICAYGASYGAYAALTGAYREPDLFKCAVGVAGVYDLPLMFEKGDVQERESGQRYMREAIGTDVNDMKQRSPVYNADKIKAKILLVHGTEDIRAPFEHAKRMREALEKAGNKPEWISQGGEAHGVGSEEHRVQLYDRMLAFFASNIGAGNVVPASN